MRVCVSWSGGKDAAWALHTLRLQGIDVVALLTLVDEDDRTAVHRIRRRVHALQVGRTGLPAFAVEIPRPCSDDVYRTRFLEGLQRMQGLGVTHVAFGDLHLDDVRAWREALLEDSACEALFPLWGRETGILANDMVRAGVGGRVVCVDTEQLPAQFVGRSFDSAFLEDLPRGVDACGENGEFHTLVTAGPMFDRALAIRMGEVRHQSRFSYADVLPRWG